MTDDNRTREQRALDDHEIDEDEYATQLQALLSDPDIWALPNNPY